MNPPSILYAEDDLVTRELFRTFFSRVGWSYELASDGESAARRLEERSFDVIITDICMPGMSGLDLMRRIHDTNPQQLVVVVTGSGTAEDILEIMRAGASEVIQKPVDFDSLERSIRRLVSAVRVRDLERQLYGYVSNESTVVDLSTAECAALKVPLPVLDRLFRAGRISLNSKLRVELAFQEALTNSLEHGNLELESSWKDIFDDQGIDRYSHLKRERLADPYYRDRRIRIEMSYADETLTLRIKDNGMRAWRSDSGAECSSMACYGRGIRIIQDLMDEVRYADNGSLITMVKRLGGQAVER